MDPHKLTPKQAMFVIEYLKDLNAAQAAIRAGYSEDSAKEIGYENLTKPHINQAIEEQMAARAKRTLLNADYVISGLMEIAERCRQATPVNIKDKDGKYVPSGIWEFDSGGANKALETLAKHLKLITDKMELGNADGSNFEFPAMQRIYVGKPDDIPA